METIIGLLIVLLPLVLKAIEKKFQNSGKQAQAEKVREFMEKYIDEDESILDEDDEQEPVAEPVQTMAPAPVLRPEPERKPVVRPVIQERRPLKRKSAMLLEEQPVERKEKIDPKKLVLYSEIMKPKFSE